jgi:anti-sigma-K factor RskA
MSAEHEELENSVAAYLLGSVEPDEEERVRAHLAGCASCRELVARLAPGVSALPLELEPVKPPARLEERLVAGATALRGPAAAGAATWPHPKRPRQLTLAGRPLVPLRLRGTRAGLAAAAAVLIALGVAGGVAVDRLALPGSGGQPSVAGVQHYQLAGHGPMTGVQARAVYLKQDAVTVVDFRRLPDPGPNRVYQLWLITDEGKAVSAAVFSPESDGSKVVAVDHSLTGVRALAVTVEPGPDGSPVPSQTPQLEGRIA